MDRHIVHKNKGVCSSQVSFDYVDGHVYNVAFEGGCAGNTQGVARLAEGMTPQQIDTCLKGIQCHGGNSCPNELALAMEELMAEEKN